MNVSVSPQMRAVALVGIVAVLGLAVAVFAMSRKSSSGSTTSAPVQRVHRVQPPMHRTKPAPRQTTKPVHRTHPKPYAPVVQAALAQGLPLAVAEQFAKHEAVVVELYSADAPVDNLALDEAKSGAKAGNAGFLAVDVTGKKDATARALATKLGVLDAPVLLVFKRPGQVTVRINGFSDHETVAQAAVIAAAPA
jgi:thiol:disulfide interchange protein